MGVWRVVGESCSRFGQETSIAGLNNAAKARSLVRSLLWLTVFTAFMCFTVRGIVQVVVDFYARPVITNINVTHKAEVPFPAVTVCNLNRVHCLNLMETFLTLKKEQEDFSRVASASDAALLSELDAQIGDMTRAFFLSGCNEQMCWMFEGSLPRSRTERTWADQYMTLFPDFNCDAVLPPTALARVCYYLQMMIEDKTLDSILVSGANWTFHNVSCEVSVLCDYVTKKAGVNSPEICQTLNRPRSSPASGGGVGGGTAPTSGSSDTGSDSKAAPGSSDSPEDGSDPKASSGSSDSKESSGPTDSKPGSDSKESSDPDNPGSDSKNASDPSNSGSGSKESLGPTDSGTDPKASSGPSNSQPSGPGNERKRRQAPPPASPVAAPPTRPDDAVAPPGPETTADFKLEAAFLLLYMGMDPELRFNTSHLFGARDLIGEKVKGLIVGCSYKGVDCMDEKLWTRTFAPSYGNCYTFNSAENEELNMTYMSTLTGPTNGLVLKLHIDQRFHMVKKLSKEAGVRLVLHDSHSRPLPDEYGIDLAPNTASSIAVQLTELTRLESPYSANCTKHWKQTIYSDYVSNHEAYSLAGCQRMCMQLAMQTVCKCFYPKSLPVMQLATANSTLGRINPCNIDPDSSDNDQTCILDVLESFNNNSLGCPCNVACTENVFSSSVSASTWPSDQYWRDFAYDMGVSAEKLNNPKIREALKEDIQKDFAKATVYYQTLNVQTISQEPKYSPDAFFSGLGGALSLYLGIAVIMIFELIEFGYDLFVAVWNYYGSESAGKMRRNK